MQLGVSTDLVQSQNTRPIVGRAIYRLCEAVNMLFDLPNHNEFYQALLNRDPRFEGKTYLALLTTGMFFRLTCPARKPQPKNCSF